MKNMMRIYGSMYIFLRTLFPDFFPLHVCRDKKSEYLQEYIGSIFKTWETSQKCKNQFRIFPLIFSFKIWHIITFYFLLHTFLCMLFQQLDIRFMSFTSLKFPFHSENELLLFDCSVCKRKKLQFHEIFWYLITKSSWTSIYCYPWLRLMLDVVSVGLTVIYQIFLCALISINNFGNK